MAGSASDSRRKLLKNMLKNQRNGSPGMSRVRCLFSFVVVRVCLKKHAL